MQETPSDLQHKIFYAMILGLRIMLHAIFKDEFLQTILSLDFAYIDNFWGYITPNKIMTGEDSFWCEI